MHEDEIPDVGITTGHGTFVADTGDVRGHRSVAKQNMSRDRENCDAGAPTVMLEHMMHHPVVVLLLRCQNKCQIPEILKVWSCIRPS